MKETTMPDMNDLIEGFLKRWMNMKTADDGADGKEPEVPEIDGVSVRPEARQLMIDYINRYILMK